MVGEIGLLDKSRLYENALQNEVCDKYAKWAVEWSLQPVGTSLSECSRSQVLRKTPIDHIYQLFHTALTEILNPEQDPGLDIS